MKINVPRILACIALFACASFSQITTTKVTASGLKGAVTVRRDGRGIPYIEALNDADLYFTQGYVTASDRLWQMDLMRRLARGETAEIFGNLGFEQDKRWRRYGFSAIADQTLAVMSPDLHAALDDYARGVNAYIATLDDNSTPVEFKILQYKPKQWSASDSIVIGKILADALSTTWQNDILRASLQSLPKDKFADLTNQVTPYDVVLFGKDRRPAATSLAECPRNISPDMLAAAKRDEQIRAESLAMVGFYAEDLAASNNWVISGKRTADGKPLLANDPHLAPSAPGVWYLTHLATPTMRVSGVTVPGAPGIVAGHNGSIAWGVTNVGPDVQDLYFETFNDQGEYKTPTGWTKPVLRKETIKVRSSPAKTETTDVTFEVVETNHGIIVSEDGGKKYALRWTGRDPENNDLVAYFKLNRATNWNEFKDALRTNGGPMQNFVYADAKGNIGWYAASRIPIRRTGDGGVPYDGATTDGDWIGYIPFNELPNLYNPADGLIVTANQRIVGTSYKYFSQMSRAAASPWRARRIHDALMAKPKLTMDDVRDVQKDVLNIPLSNLAKEIVKLGAASPETLSVLKDWDGRMAADSHGAVLANEIRECIANKMADANKPTPTFLVRERIIDWAVREQATRWLPSGFADYPAMMKACDASTRTSLADTKRLGPDPTTWAWGRIFQSRFPHPLAGVPFIGTQFTTPIIPIEGSGSTPNVGSSVSMRHIASPGNWDATRHVIPLGQSGDPASPHFKDQFEAWKNGTPTVFPFSKEAVEKAAVRITVLTPR